MIWALAGVLYAGAYVAVTLALDQDQYVRLLIGNAALLLPPLAPLVALLLRRGSWFGRHAIFFAAIGAWPLLWLIGQLAWTWSEVVRSTPLPWFEWHIILQLCGSALPLIALVAWPHRGARPETAITAAVDVSVLTFVTGFVYWCLIVVPGMDPAHSRMALTALATIGPLVRLAAVAGFVFAIWKARRSPWVAVYQRLALGLAIAFVVLTGLSFVTLAGAYQTGSPGDIGWMLPFWFAAWAISVAPASQPDRVRSIATLPARHSSTALLLAAIVAVPVVGYGARYFVPLGPGLDATRETATVATIIGGMALVMMRLRVEQRAVEQAYERVRILAAACEQTGELILIMADNRIEYANDAFCRATGYSRDELYAAAPGRLIASDSPAPLPGIGQALGERDVVRANATLARKDGTTFQVEWSAATIADATGRVTRVVAVVRDLTEQLRLRDQLVRGERLSAIGELVSGVAHEINNPLQSVIGTLELLLAESHEPHAREDLARARFEAGRAGRIIRNLLTFVRRSPAERILVDLNEIVQSTVALRSYELTHAGIEVREDYGGGLPVVLANRDEIQQVILNLIINAQHAMARAHQRGVLSIRTYVDVDRAIVEVSDDGPGISPQAAGRIFEPFFTTKSVGAGTGLGLSLAFGIANAHGGSLEVVPAARGACFRLSLPGAGFPGPSPVH